MLEAVSKKQVAKKEKALNELISKFVFSPLKAGIGGFAAFFTILILTKLFAYLMGIQNIFEVDVYDLLLSTIGFILSFLIRFLENFKEKN